MVTIGLLINAALAFGKLGAGIFGHADALIADAVESFADIVGSIVVLAGIRFAMRPPDEDHPYGHGKAEALAAFVVSTMLLGAGIWIGIHAFREMLNPKQPPAVFTMFVALGVIVIKETLFQVARASAQKSQSSAALAEAWHHRADAITSVAALIGISIAVIGGPRYAMADDIAAIFASVLIVFSAVRIMGPPLAELLDAAPEELIDQVRLVAKAVPGVIDVEKIHARKSGQRYLVDMHLHVDGNLTVTEAHALGGRTKAVIREKMPNVLNVLMHVEPAETPAKQRSSG